MASFPYFNGTGSVKIQKTRHKISVDILTILYSVLLPMTLHVPFIAMIRSENTDARNTDRRI